MLNKISGILLSSSIAFFAVSSADAMPINDGATTSPLIVNVADGCGGGRYRGPGGACHRFGRGPFPGGYWGSYTNSGWNGCPPGSWRGPWGHCRNTPYHGRLPGGGWK
jgi:hypothetical protein